MTSQQPHDAVPPAGLRRWWPVAAVGLLVTLAAVEIGLDYAQRSRVAPRAQWDAAATAVRKQLRPGDLVVTAPRWADPLGRLVLGDRMTLDDVTRPDGATYARIFELSLRGARHPDTRGARAAWRRSFGAVTVTRWERTPVKVTTDFYRALPRASVWEERGGRRVATCPWHEGHARFDCRANWKSVRAVRGEIGFTPRRCIFAHPVEGAARVVEFPPLPLGGRLVVWTGLKGYDPRYRARRAVWEYQRWRAGRLKRKRPLRPVAAVPIRLAVAVGGRPLATLEHSIHDEGWHRHEIRLPRQSAPQPVRFTITTRHAWAKPFCFYARSEEAAP